MSERSLKAGVARREISPAKPELLRPTGMGRLASTRGVLDTLHVEALAFEAGGQGAIVCTSDLRYIPYPWHQQVAASLAEQTGVDPECVLLSSTHNHCSSPEAANDSDEAKAAEKDANKLIVQGFIDAGLEAWHSRRPAEVAGCRATLQETIGLNRRVRLSNGTGINCWGSGPMIPWGQRIVGPAGPHSDRVHILAVREPGARFPFAVLTSYSSHPHLYELPYFSGGYAGAAKRAVQERIPGCICLYASGPAGDIDLHTAAPIWPGGESAEVAWFKQSAAMLGRRFANTVVPAVPREGYTQPEILKHAYYFEGYNKGTPPERKAFCMIGAVKIGKSVLVSLPGELFNIFGLAMHEANPDFELFLMTLNGSMCGYSAPALAFEQGSYEVMRGPAGDPESPFAHRLRAKTDTGEHVVEKVNEVLARLR